MNKSFKIFSFRCYFLNCIIESFTGYAYDDVILMPGHIDFGVDAVDMKTQFSRNISITVPLAR